MVGHLDPGGVGLIDVSGSAAARGRAQGSAFRDAVHSHLAALLGSLERAGIDAPEAYLRELVGNTTFREDLACDMPHLLDEVGGVAEGAGLDPELVYALQLMDEEWAYRGARGARPKREKCSSIALRDSQAGATWIGQNMDLGDYTDGFQRVVRHASQGGRPGALILTTAGVIALLGANDAGVAVCVNSLPQLPSTRHGIPVAFMIRRLLEARSAAEAAELCRSLPHATNQHYLVADAELVVSLECSAAGVMEYRSPDAARVLHTNHPLAGSAERYPDREANSVARLRTLEARVAGGRPSLEVMQAALTARDDPDNPVCRPGSEGGLIGFTTCSMISRLSASTPRVESWLSFGPPSERGYQLFEIETARAAAW